MKKLRFCPNVKGLALTDGIEGIRAVVRLRCKQWTCDYCGERNRKMWMEYLNKTLPEVSNSWAFITLTAPPDAHANKTTLEHCQRGVDLLLKRMRHLGEIDYVRVFEPHKTGAIHAHLIVSGMPERVAWELSQKSVKKGKEPAKVWFISHDAPHTWALKSWLKKGAWEVGLGYIVDVQFIRKDVYRAVNYILKYMVKDLQVGIKKKGLRRIAVSRDIGSPSNKSELDWFVKDFLTAGDVDFAESLGLKLVDLTIKKEITKSDFDSDGIYPPIDS